MSDDQPDPANTTVEVAGPRDPGGAARAALQERLGLEPKPDEEWDAFAQEFRDHFGAMMAGISLVMDGCDLYFIGLDKRADLPEITEADRTMARGWGYCGLLITKRVAPLLINTKDKPEYATNPVAQYAGVEAYGGDELRTPSGEEFATVWMVDDTERDWTLADAEWIKAFARKLEARIIERSGLEF